MHWVPGAIKVEFRPYHRPFKQPLQTHHGEWRQREGIIVRLTDAAERVGFGEIAPIPWFGSETIAAALDFCRRLPTWITPDMVDAIPNELPACQFGVESALAMLTGEDFALRLPLSQPTTASIAACSALLPPGAAAIAAALPLMQQGYRTFKLKIGVFPIEDERKVLESLVVMLSSDRQLRLDANGGLSLAEAATWLETSHCINLEANHQRCCRIEFLEQPLPPDRFPDMLQLADRYATPIALDESVATLAQLQTCYQNGWRDVFVIKPAIAGSPSRLRQFCQQTGIDVVLSSVFETAIGQQAALELAMDITTGDRAVGFGLNHWFPDDDPLHCVDAGTLWNRLNRRV